MSTLIFGIIRPDTYKLKTIILLLLVLFGVSIVALSQTKGETSILTGLVYDDYGAVIVNASIKVRGEDKVERLFRTDENGNFELALKPGNYSIEIGPPGFQTFRVEKFRVISPYKGKQNLDVALEVGPCSDCHMIEADQKIKKPK